MYDLTKEEEKRFWKHVEKKGKDECWPWNGPYQGYGRDGTGKRGRFNYNKGDSSVYPHRLTFDAANPGVLIPGMNVHHRCHNGGGACLATDYCVNPAHLYMGTQQDNVDDMVEAGRSLKGSRRPEAILTDEQVLSAYGLWAYFGHKKTKKQGTITIRSLANSLGCSRSSLNCAFLGYSWPHLQPRIKQIAAQAAKFRKTRMVEPKKGE